MNFTVSAITQSLADYLAPVLPGVTMYEDPNQQGTDPPCMFLQQRYSYLTLQTGGYWLRRIGLDLTYLLDYNLTDLQTQYQTAAESLDLVMETVPYNDGTGTALVRTYDREWRIDLDAMHYRFELRERVKLPKDANQTKMQTMDYNQQITGKD